jgi:uncharacterized protein (DUF433 family)
MMSAINDKEWKWLERDPKSSLKQLSIKDRRIRARTLYGMHVNDEAPMRPEEIAADYNLPLEAVLEAIEYCQADPPEIRDDFEAEERSIEEAERRGDPNFWGPKRIAAYRAAHGLDQAWSDALDRAERDENLPR